MRRKSKGLLGLALLAALALGYEHEDQPAAVHGFRAHGGLPIGSDVLQKLRARALELTRLQEQEMLVDGMVIIRHDGEPADFCDSLLFSTLRNIGLLELGLYQEAHAANAAWRQAEEAPGQWRRHPRCGKTLSRDMLLGLELVMAQDPTAYRDLLRRLLSFVRDNSGLVSQTTSFTGIVNPEHALRLRYLAELNAVPRDEWPLVLHLGTAKTDWLSVPADPGYTRHLDSLLLLVDLYLARQGIQPPSFAGELAQRLARGNPANLFFVFLARVYAHGGKLPDYDRELLATELLTMAQFPTHGLPMNCHRRADYLWQRAWADYSPWDTTCSSTFPAVDFTFLAGLILGWP